MVKFIVHYKFNSMKLILRILLTAIAVVVISEFLPGITLDEGYKSAIIVAIVLGLLRVTVKPLLIFFTLPATIVTLGLFLLVINAVIIMLAGYFVTGFTVSGFWVALLFSLLLSLFQSILYSFLEENKEK
ncbi:putative membrane protein [Lutibacter oceani]|uniref:Putative membrane protein n=2 Tax=Lutibacter oceani TaxID=1853311 RepID=A0A3D9RVN3_9FLAO|nr:putative membrane protein [Lutibacter oceani]